MPLIFLSENNSLSRKALKNPFSEKNVSLFEIPVKKMRKRDFSLLRERLINTEALFLASPGLNHLMPEKSVDARTFFDSFIIDLLKSLPKYKNISEKRLVLVNPSDALVLSAVNVFSDIALAGENALHISNNVYKMTGASIPIVSGCGKGDTVLCYDGSFTSPRGFSIGIDIDEKENSLSVSSLKFYPEKEYSSVTALIGRPLNLNEAALLSEYDNKATFNIVF